MPKIVQSATIRDVAAKADVSITTVSHVVNNTRKVANETRERVLEAIGTLGYRPSSIARALKADRTYTLGMVVTSSTNPFFAEVIRGVEECCFARGYSLILCNTGDEKDRLLSNTSTLLEKRIDAMVAMTTNADRYFFEELGDARPVPLAVIDTLPIRGAVSVNDDSEAGGALAARRFLDGGLTRLAVLAGPRGHPRSEQRLKGFRGVLDAAGLAFGGDAVVATDLTVSSGFEAMNRLLRMGGQRPQGVFCLNDMLAIGALSAAANLGLKVPDELSVIGYDDIEMAAFTVPPLTTVRQPARDIGFRAAAAVLDWVEGHDPSLGDAGDARSGIEIVLDPELVERGSVRPAALLEPEMAHEQ